MIKKLNIIAIFSVAVLMNSCGLYNKYQSPQTSLDSINVMRDAALYTNSGDTTSFGTLDWHEVFTDPQLQTLIQTALDNNFDLLNAAENVKIAEAQLMTARLAFIPSFTFSPNGTLSKVMTEGSSWSKTYSLPVTASWNTGLFGNLATANRSAKVALIATQDYQQSVRSKVICNVANLYYTLLMLDRQLEILNDMEKLTSQTLEMMKLQKELRGARETSVVSAEAAHLSVLSQTVDMKRQIQETENTLSLLLGQPAQGISRGKLDAQSLPSSFSTGVGVSVLRNRPDVHAAEMSLAECFYGVQSARQQFYPVLNLSATGAFTNNLDEIVNPGKFLLSFVGQLTQPIFQNGRLVAGLRVAKAQYQQQYNTWQSTILTAGSEVANALVLYNSSKEKYAVDTQQVEALKKSVDYTSELFNMGSSTYLEVISAQSNLLNAEITQLSDQFNAMQAVVNLYSALGGGAK